jgi:hypothetical protein
METNRGVGEKICRTDPAIKMQPTNVADTISSCFRGWSSIPKSLAMRSIAPETIPVSYPNRNPFHEREEGSVRASGRGRDQKWTKFVIGHNSVRARQRKQRIKGTTPCPSQHTLGPHV